MEDMKNNYGKYICIIHCFIIYAAGDKFLTNVECKVDYLGIVTFEINLPNRYNSWQDIHPTFYYKTVDSIENWRQEVDCKYVNKNEKYKCAMHELTNNERSSIEKITDYEFKLSILQNTTFVNITTLYFTNFRNIALSPWRMLNHIAHCDDAYGVKYMAINASYINIDVEWLLFPFHVDYFEVLKTCISIEGVHVDTHPWQISKATHCKDDFCKFNFQRLTHCSKYNICIVTDGNLELEEEKKGKCLIARTYCNNTSGIVKWQDTLLCVFGAIMLITCIPMLGVLFIKHIQFGGVFNNKNKDEIVNQEELVNPSQLLHVNNNNVDSIDYEHLYHYPFTLITALSSIGENGMIIPSDICEVVVGAGD